MNFRKEVKKHLGVDDNISLSYHGEVTLVLRVLLTDDHPAPHIIIQGALLWIIENRIQMVPRVSQIGHRYTRVAKSPLDD